MTINFWYLADEDQHIPETKSAIGQTCQRLFCLTGYQNTIENNATAQGRKQRVHGVCVF